MFPISLRHSPAKFNGANFLEGIVTVLWIASLSWTAIKIKFWRAHSRQKIKTLMPSDWWSQESIQNSIARSLNTKAWKASNCSHKTGLSTMSHASCVHELSIKLSWELLRIPENNTSYLFSWNITQTTNVGTLNRKLLTDVMMLLKKIENKFL